MKLCLVTAFPPSRRGLNEYGFHIAQELRNNPLLEVTILADMLPSPQPELSGFHVVRCWDFNRAANPYTLLREIRRIKPDLVWLNLGFASFGDKPLHAFTGLAIPALIRMMGYPTHITLHQLMDTVDLKDAGVRFPGLYRMAGALITRILLLSNSVSVLLPEYGALLRERYGAHDVHVRPHGILSGEPEYPDFSRRGNPRHRLLAFGKWGTYKRLEPLLEAFQIVVQEFPDAHLVIAGGDHPKTPGYVESIARVHAGDPRIEFTGYVPEEAIGDLFRTATVTVMPYTSSAGSSGVAHLACQYGVPILASRIHDFQELAKAEGVAIEFFQCGDTRDLARELIELLKSPEKQEQMSLQNFAVGLHMTMPRIIRDYIRRFDVQDRIRKMRTIARYRRFPRWVPLRDQLARWKWNQRVAWEFWLPPPHTLQPQALRTVEDAKVPSPSPETKSEG